MNNVELAKQIVMYSATNDKTRCTAYRDVDINSLAFAYLQEHEKLAAVKARNVSLTSALADKLEILEVMQHKANRFDERLDYFKSQVVRLSKENKALKEKYRWRDADKEPAPKQADDRTRFVLVHERQYETMTTAQYFYEDKTWYDFGGESVDVDYWRPLEFPEAKV